MKTLLIIPALLFCNGALAQANPQQQRKMGSPIDHLPRNIEILTSFGERADFSPDNQRVAFMAKSFGDAMVIDLKTKKITCLTCRVPAAAFLRVMHLVSGDYILIGPEKFEDIHISRTRDNELWFLSKEKGAKPVKLGIKMSEGMAISKKNMKIAFSQVHAQNSELPDGASRLIVADIDTTGGVPKLVNQKTVYTSPDRNCTIEAQDFFDNDAKMTLTCYEPNNLASVMTIDLVTGSVINQSKNPGTYNEVEGIFPGGEYSLVEADRQCDWLGGKRGGSNIDIWKLKLDGTGKNFERITHFNDYEGGKASNPVISSNGEYMAFQFANTADPAGVGYGLLLYKFESSAIHLADPSIFQDKGKYYLYGTVERNAGQGFQVYVSDDLKTWKLRNQDDGYALKKGEAFGTRGFWAPQVFQHAVKYYMAYTANENIAIAQGNSPAGPFTQKEIAALQAPVKQIDPFVYIDDDGKKYLYHVRLDKGNRIFVAEMEDDLSAIKPATLRECIAADQPWENTTGAWPVAEGPSILKRNGVYYLFYSANDFRNPNYAVGYATSNHPLGPWKKFAANPILDKQLIGENGTGHGDFFSVKDQLYYVFHTHNSQSAVGPRKTAIVKLNFEKGKKNEGVWKVDKSSFVFFSK
jgi:GH43 family beta-xylosidase